MSYIDVIKSVVKPALGCTEPIAAAFAAAKLSDILGSTPEYIELEVSDNLYKNSMGVYVPRTGAIGLHIATAVGAIGGKSEKNLEVLSEITKDHVDMANSYISEGRITVTRTNSDEFIFVRAIGKLGENEAEVVLEGGHTNIVKMSMNGVDLPIESNSSSKTESVLDGIDIDLEKIWNFANNSDFGDIEFILEAKVLNEELSDEGLANPYGLEIGRTIKDSANLFGKSLSSKILMTSSSASDARMGGAVLPAMSNYGSGNQGIAATMPIVEVAKEYSMCVDKIARALIISHLGAIYIKSHYPPLSAFCGNVATSAACSMAIVYMLGGTFEQGCFSIQNVLSDTSGMICDGAKSTCAMKVGSACVSGFKSAILAINSKHVQNQGIVSDRAEKSIKNLGRLVSVGMPNTDREIINIMTV